MSQFVPFFDAVEALAYAIRWLIALVVIVGVAYIAFCAARRAAYWSFFAFQNFLAKLPPHNHTPSS